MLSKIYLGLLLISFIVMGALSFLAFNWLQSIGDPAAAVQNYQRYAGLSWTTLWIAFIALVVFANIFLWRDGKGWALWTSLLFFLVFVVAQTFWLDRTFFQFQEANNLAESSYFLRPFLGVTIGAMAAVAIFFNQFIVSRLREKMFEKAEETDEEDAQKADQI